MLTADVNICQMFVCNFFLIPIIKGQFSLKTEKFIVTYNDHLIKPRVTFEEQKLPNYMCSSTREEKKYEFQI